MGKAKQLIITVIILSIVVQAIPAAIKYRVEIKSVVQELFGSVTHAVIK